MKNYHEILKQYWGFDSFRSIQENIINSIGNGKDTLGLMPTGGGKSITFQVPTLAQKGICIVITPLIALMKDQVQNLRAKDIKALAVYSGMTKSEINIALDNCIFGNYKFLYISPERINTELFIRKVQKMNVCMIAVDESHCISQWGYDFRPAYLKIADIREIIPNVPVLALTATATPKVVDDIQDKLNFKEKNVFKMSFERENVAYVVRKTEDKDNELIHILKQVKGSAIVYVRNRKKTKEITELLNQNNITATFYHAGLHNEVKDERQKEWQTNQTRVMVATNAFGMGIDKPDVRLVVHHDLPDSIEAYFQEAGRAGRDLKKSFAVLLYAKYDKTKLQKRITDSFPDKEFIKEVYNRVNYYYQMAVGDGFGCVFEFNLNEFCKKYKYFPIPVYSALKLLSNAGYIEYTDEQDNASRVVFKLEREELYKLYNNSPDSDLVVRTLLRLYTGIFTEYAYIDEKAIGLKIGKSRSEVYKILISLKKKQILDYIPRKKIPYVIYKTKRVEDKYLRIPTEVYEERKEQLKERIETILGYAESEENCRSRMLLRYFGEKNEHDCGQCDVCIQKKKRGEFGSKATDDMREQILMTLKQGKIATKELYEKVGNNQEEKFSEHVEKLLDEGSIIIENDYLSLSKKSEN